MEIFYKPSFVRSFKKLEKDLQDEVIEKIAQFQTPKNHPALKVHPLKGELKGFFSFSVNYKYRIVFEFKRKKQEVHFLEVGDHAVYR